MPPQRGDPFETGAPGVARGRREVLTGMICPHLQLRVLG